MTLLATFVVPKDLDLHFNSQYYVFICYSFCHLFKVLRCSLNQHIETLTLLIFVGRTSDLEEHQLLQTQQDSVHYGHVYFWRGVSSTLILEACLPKYTGRSITSSAFKEVAKCNLAVAASRNPNDSKISASVEVHNLSPYWF